MGRPSKNTDRELIRAGRQLIAKHGVTGMSLRQVAALAKVNLGMFSYHFGSKEEFIRQVLQEEYEEFFAVFEAQFHFQANVANPLKRLRALLVTLGNFTHENRDFLASILRDLLNGEKMVLEFGRKNAPRHITLLLQAIRECQKEGVVHADISPVQALVSCAAAIALPSVLGAVLSRGKSRIIRALIAPIFARRLSVSERVDFALRGLRP